MKERLLVVGAVSAICVGAFFLGFAVSEWRDGGKSADRCQAAAAYFEGVNSLTSSPERFGLSATLVMHADDKVADAWARAFNKMKDECS